jgi:polynucleotide 5'-kinase involved in rRNA processing|tara:strand:- start:197 stop:520 length:324 start_codon:yes stop_codon:yes gene_type:complete
MIKNKKADIPVTILVIGVFAICSMAIFSFIYSTNNIQKDFVGVGLIETINSIEEEIKFYESIGKSPNEISGIFEEVKFDGTNYIIKKDYGKDKKVLIEYKIKTGKGL